MSFIIPLMLVCITVSSAQTVTKKKMGDFVVLEPGNKPDTLNSIVWKHGEDRAAEWYEGDADESYYRIFDGSSVLNKITCSLTINNLDKRFNGTYTAEVNGLNPTKSEKLEVLDPVSSVTIFPGPDCDDDKSDNCTLTCNGTGDGPFTYSWTPGGSSASQVMVQKGKEVTEYTCVVRNPVSSKEEKYTVQAKGSSDSISGATIVGAIFGVTSAIIVIALVVYFGWYKKKCEHYLFNRGEGTNEGEGGAGGAGDAGDAQVDTNKGEGGAGGAGDAGNAQVVVFSDVNMENENEHIGKPGDNNMPKTAEEGVKGKSTQNGEPIATMEEAREGEKNLKPEAELEPEPEPEPTAKAVLHASNRAGPSEVGEARVPLLNPELDNS